MSWYRWLLCALALVLVDGSWLALLLNWIGFVVGMHGAFIAWTTCQALLVAAVLATAFRDILPDSWRGAGSLLPLLSVVALWLAVAGVASPAGDAIGAGWPLALSAGEMGITRWPGVLLAAAACAGLLRHGVRQARAPAGTQRIAGSFRIGLVVFMLILVFEVAGGLDLGTRAGLVPFFAASLLGMALARAPAHGGGARGWTAAVVAGVMLALVLGGLVAAAAVVILHGGLSLLHSGWLAFATGFVDSVGAALAQLLGNEASPEWSMQGGSRDLPQGLVLLGLLAGAGLFGYLAQRVLREPRRRWPKLAVDLGREEHEPITDAGPMSFSTLVQALGPGWLRARRGATDPLAGIRDPGIREAYRLYQRLLALARERGLALDPAHTPFERARMMGRALPRVPVDALTRNFVEACYGGKAAPPQVMAEMERALDAAFRKGR